MLAMLKRGMARMKFSCRRSPLQFIPHPPLTVAMQIAEVLSDLTSLRACVSLLNMVVREQ